MTTTEPSLEGSSANDLLSQEPIGDRAAELVDQRRRSYNWLHENYWPEWIQAFKNYKCNRDPHKDDNDPKKDDLTQTAIGMPDTWALVRRLVARVTAQLPNLKFRADDPEIAQRISRALMYQWDKGGVQRVQKRHVTQAAIFGWSVRGWWWDFDERIRKRRINPLDPSTDPQWLTLLDKQYAEELALYGSVGMEPTEAIGKIIADKGRGGMLPVEYRTKAYEGPRTEFLFIGDCFPEPNFQSIQTSNWFIIQRRRNKEWLLKLVKMFPQFAAGVEELFKMHPKGTPRSSQGRIPQELRLELLAAADRVDELLNTESSTGPTGTIEWTILERHIPGSNPKLAYVGEESVWIGEIPHPYELEGKIPFTELVFVDDMLAGIGDSNARIIRGLQEMHTRNQNQRYDLVDKLLRPIYGTSDRVLFQNPNQLERGKGFSLVLTKGPGTVWPMGEQGALASAANSGSNEEASIGRMIQMATGDSNLSQSANVDPQQARTATGARIMAYNGDILAKDQIDMFTLSLHDDLEIMYLLNRSELSGPISFDANQYSRNVGSDPSQQQDQTPQKMTAMPDDFQYDGEVEVEVGSTLADDDDANLSKAQTVWQVASSRPDIFNVQKAGVDLLIAMGKGKDLQAYQAPPPPPPLPPEIKSSSSLPVRVEMLSPSAQFKLVNDAYPAAGLTPEDFQPPPMNMTPPIATGPAGPAGGPPGGGPGMPGPGGPPPAAGPGGPPMGAAPPMMGLPPDAPPLGASELEAARGKSPLPNR